MTEAFYIMSLKYSRGDVILWWKPRSMGYTLCLDQTGIYTDADVKKLGSLLDDAVAVPCLAADDVAARYVPIDMLDELKRFK